MFKPKRIHPVGMILSFVKMIKSYIIPAIVFFFVVVEESFNLYFIIGGICLVLIIVIVSVLGWLKFTYWIEDGEFRIEYGVIVKKKRYIPIERIQSINSSAGIIQQIFRLVKVQIETAGGGMEAEAVLTAISKSEAEAIEQALASYKHQLTEEPIEEDELIEKPDYPSYKIKPKELFVAASTSSGIGVIISAVAAFLSQFDEFIPYEKLLDRFDFLANASFTLYAILVFFGFFIAWVLSVIGVLLKYAFFTVTKIDDEIKISRGIFEKRQISIPLTRIQAIKVVQNPLRQLLGYSTVYIESAGGTAGDDGGSSTIVFPVIQKKDLMNLLDTYLPNFKLNEEVYSLPKRSMSRYIIRKALLALIVIVPVSYLLFPWGLLSILLLLVGILWGYQTFKDTGWYIVDNQLQLAYRFVSKSTILVRRNRIQSINHTKTFFQEKKSLKTFRVSIKSGIVGKSFSIKDMDDQDVEKLLSWYSYSSENKTRHNL
ncbi:PH domain-containing protein [Metabacillus litoralis]|uniref:PH domain-containing protein n=1 Tax=Metabacillus litoralis TaxID=152268 RepID=UPI001CFD83FA|nr:PH domain-containing protein [Metabacillus litoralis]